MSVTLDAKMTAGNSADGFSQQASAVTTISSTGITVGGSATLLEVALVLQGATAATGLSATWNGVPMSLGPTIQQTAAGHTVTVALFSLVNPASGANVLQASWTNAADAYMSAASFAGTDTTTGIQSSDDVTNSAATSIAVTSDANGATVALFGCDGAAPTMNFNAIFGNSSLNPGGGASYQLGGTSNTHTFTAAGGNVQCLAGQHVKAAAGASGVVGWSSPTAGPSYRI